MILEPGMKIMRFQIKLRVGNKAIQVRIDLHQYSARDRKNPLGLHCDILDCSNSVLHSLGIHAKRVFFWGVFWGYFSGVYMTQ